MITLIKGKPHANGLEIIVPPSPLLICSCSFLRTKIDTQILAPRPTGTTYFLRRERSPWGGPWRLLHRGRGFGVGSLSLGVRTRGPLRPAVFFPRLFTPRSAGLAIRTDVRAWETCSRSLYSEEPSSQGRFVSITPSVNHHRYP